MYLELAILALFIFIYSMVANIVINAEVPGGEYLALVVICTVFLSLVAHGISANPLARWLGKKEQ